MPIRQKNRKERFHVRMVRHCNWSTADIRDPLHPKEIGYFNKPLMPGANTVPTKAGAFAMSAPAYDEKTHDIWYSDGNTGFYVVHLTPHSGAAKFARQISLPGN